MSEVRETTPVATTATTPQDSRRPRARPARVLAILAVVALLAVAIGGKRLYDRRVTHRAALTAANAEVLRQVDERYAAIDAAARASVASAARLGVTLQEHLVVSQPERTDAQLTADRHVQQAALAWSGRQLLDAGSAPPPELPPLADEPVLHPHLRRLAELQRGARQQARQVLTLAVASERWGAAVTNLRAEAQRYVDVANADRNARGDPAALLRQWERERAVLEQYRAAALDGKEVSGLAAYADAFLGYIDGTRAFIEEAVTLLRQGQIERYNRRLQEVFGVPDPFGFNAAITAATGEALGSGLILSLTQARNAINTLLDEVAAARDPLGPHLRTRRAAAL
ncbi:MAG: hypothetical protein M3O70_01855 [Actinomycetota bacterium]|nr:hypothetical protein [Actinomycetota bacterium]